MVGGGVAVGVGELDSDPAIRPNYVTNRTEGGDFKAAVANNFGISPEKTPWLFVVKKNKSILEQLYQWIKHHVANVQDPETGRKLVTHLPLLIIDDEADQASVDTENQVFDADGNADEEHNPTAINKRIRRILNSFTRSAYVGYTATPFANIFIHDRNVTREEGPDLFPSSFIVNLAAPSNYAGPSVVFGNSKVDGLPLLRPIDDDEHWIPNKHNRDFKPRFDGESNLPPSLIQAIDAFILGTAIRKCRGQGQQHSSMLIHVTRYNAVQNEVYEQVSLHVKKLIQRLSRGINKAEIIERLRALWESDFQETTEVIMARGIDPTINSELRWEEIEKSLLEVLNDIVVKKINGTAKDALDYSNHEKTGLKTIAIGGDKLARGLTLEGLVVSYFLRASRMYDTLMQMGRWFGYRPGYIDLSRLYTTNELIKWFSHISEASEELREEFELMDASGGTPADYGLKVKSHSLLMVTSRIKMRASKKLSLSFSGGLVETIALRNGPDDIQRNYECAAALIRDLGKPSEVNPKRSRGDIEESWTGYLWRGVSSSAIVRFLDEYRTHPDAYRVNSVAISQFINSMVAVGELTDWTVSIIGGRDGVSFDLLPGIQPRMLKRAAKQNRNDRYSFGRLMSPRDEAIDLDADEWNAALELTQKAWKPDPARLTGQVKPTVPNGPAIRKLRGEGCGLIKPHPERGVLFIYFLDPETSNVNGFDVPIVAFAISFPGSKSGVKVEYQVNNILWEQEYGSID